MLTAKTHTYLIHGLSGTPDVVESLLAGVAADDPRWDTRLAPDRFTLREVLAHLADWEPIWKMRVALIRAEDKPFIADIDEGEVAIQNDYANSNPLESMKRFREGRAALAAEYKSVGDDEWERFGLYMGTDAMSIEGYLALNSGHDAYHTQQIAQSLKAI